MLDAPSAVSRLLLARRCEARITSRSGPASHKGYSSVFAHLLAKASYLLHLWLIPLVCHDEPGDSSPGLGGSSPRLRDEVGGGNE